MVEVEQNAVIIFVPLLLTIVAQLSSLARDAVDDPENWKQPPLLLPFLDDRALPGLGRLNYVHATNYLLLLMGFILVVAMDPESGLLVKNLLGLMVLLVWLQLPLLEIDEYAEILRRRENGNRKSLAPWSLYLHVAATFVVVAYVVAFFPEAELLTSVDLFSLNAGDLPQAVHPFSQAGLVVLVAVAVGGFLFQFGREVPGDGSESEDGDGGSERGTDPAEGTERDATTSG